jgi:hypothetical protein
MRNSADAPGADQIRNAGAIPYASQIPNDSDSQGDFVSDVLNNAGDRLRVKVAGISPETLNNEQSTALGGSALNQWAPLFAVFHMEDVGVGVAANGDVQMSIGITTGGTEILAATALTNLIAIDTKFIMDLSAVVKPALPANSTIFVKVTTADTTAGADHFVDAYIEGIIIPTAT